QSRLRARFCQITDSSDTERLAVSGRSLALAGALAADVRAPAQELLDLALVRVGLLGAAHHRSEAQLLAKLQGGLPRRVAVVEPGRLEEPVVDPASESKLVQDLVGDPEAEPAQRAGGQPRAPRGKNRKRPFAEQPRDLRQGQ